MTNDEYVKRLLKILQACYQYGYRRASIGLNEEDGWIEDELRAIQSLNNDAIGGDEPIMSGGTISSLQKEARNHLRQQLRKVMGSK